MNVSRLVLLTISLNTLGTTNPISSRQTSHTLSQAGRACRGGRPRRSSLLPVLAVGWRAVGRRGRWRSGARAGRRRGRRRTSGKLSVHLSEAANVLVLGSSASAGRCMPSCRSASGSVRGRQRRKRRRGTQHRLALRRRGQQQAVCCLRSASRRRSADRRAPAAAT